MGVSKDEHLSALVDDEAGEFERRRLMDELIASERDTPPAIDTGFAARVSAALAEETMDDAPPAHRAGRLAKPVAGFAMAASVAVATVLGVQGFMSPQEGAAPAGGPTVTAQASQPVSSGIRQVAVTSSAAPAVAERQAVNLNGYIVRHTEYAAEQGMLPQARVVGYTNHGE